MRRTKPHQYPIFTERSKNSQPPSLLLVEGFTRHTVKQTGLNLIKDFFLGKDLLFTPSIQARTEPVQSHGIGVGFSHGL
jgi:hypothetical protein